MALTVKGIEKLGPGRHSDGDGLMLLVKPSGAKAWVLRIQLRGKRVERGLGPHPQISLSEAREKAWEMRRDAFAADELPPTIQEARAARRAAEPTPEPQRTAPTVREVADDLIEAKRAGWRNRKHAQQWANTLEQHAGRLMDRPIDAVTLDDVYDTLRPIWSAKPETAARVRQRLESVFDAATARGLRTDLNPARWRGGLAALLPASTKVKRRTGFAAMAWQSVPAFYAALCEREGIAALALRWTILTAARSGETRGATWDEIDTDNALWTVPADRMKAGREHRVPLTQEAMDVLLQLDRDQSDLVFPGSRPRAGGERAPLSDMTMGAVMKRMGVTGATVHGFRSSFRDWAADHGEDFHVAEACLAHQLGDEVVNAYLRTTMLHRRRDLLQRWSQFVVSGSR